MMRSSKKVEILDPESIDLTLQDKLKVRKDFAEKKDQLLNQFNSLGLEDLKEKFDRFKAKSQDPRSDRYNSVMDPDPTNNKYNEKKADEIYQSTLQLSKEELEIMKLWDKASEIQLPDYFSLKSMTERLKPGSATTRTARDGLDSISKKIEVKDEKGNIAKKVKVKNNKVEIDPHVKLAKEMKSQLMENYEEAKKNYIAEINKFEEQSINCNEALIKASIKAETSLQEYKDMQSRSRVAEKHTTKAKKTAAPMTTTTTTTTIVPPSINVTNSKEFTTAYKTPREHISDNKSEADKMPSKQHTKITLPLDASPVSSRRSASPSGSTISSPRSSKSNLRITTSTAASLRSENGSFANPRKASSSKKNVTARGDSTRENEPLLTSRKRRSETLSLNPEPASSETKSLTPPSNETKSLTQPSQRRSIFAESDASSLSKKRNDKSETKEKLSRNKSPK